MQATVIIPILSLIALVIKSVFGIEIGQEEIEQVADIIVTIILGAVTLVGNLKTYSTKIKDSQKDKNKK